MARLDGARARSLAAAGGMLCGAWFAAVPAAQAGAFGEAGLANFQFQLTDLDLADGIAPSYSLVAAAPDSPFRQRTELTVSVSNSAEGSSDAAINADFAFLAPLAASRTVTGNSATSTSTATSLYALSTSAARGSATAFASSESNIGFSGSYGVLLSANTALTVTADATVRASDGGVAGAEGFPFEHGRAEAFLRLRSDGQPDSLGIRTAETAVNALADTVDQSGTVSATFQNLSSGSIFGYLSARATSAAYGVSPVPEPPVWAMGLAGLGMLVLLRRRRLR